MTRTEPLTAVFIHSPFLSPITWRPVSGALERMGQSTRVLDLRDALDAGGDFHEAVGRLAARQMVEPSVLIAHSGAGALIPSIIQYASAHGLAAIFVDALLPHPSRSWMATIPESLAARLRAGARNGRAPPWPSWFPNTALAKLLPDEAMRMSLVEEAPAVPLAFLEEPAPEIPKCFNRLPAGYLQLNSAYDAEADEARAMGWPVERFEGHHLSVMTEPAEVAVAIVQLAAKLVP